MKYLLWPFKVSATGIIVTDCNNNSLPFPSMVSRVAPFVLPSLGVNLKTRWDPRKWFENDFISWLWLWSGKYKQTIDLLLALGIKMRCFYILPEKLVCRIQITRHKYKYKYKCTPVFCMLTNPVAPFQCSGHIQRKSSCCSVYFWDHTCIGWLGKLHGNVLRQYFTTEYKPMCGCNMMSSWCVWYYRSFQLNGKWVKMKHHCLRLWG